MRIFGAVVSPWPPVADAAVQETPVEDLRNALQVVEFSDPFTMSPLQIRDNLMAISARLMKALVKLEGSK